MELPALLAANTHYRQREFTAPLHTPRPARKLVILTCMDARLDLFRSLGLDVGDSHLLRNAGGRASADAIRSLVVSAHLLGTREFGVIHHTNCGLEATTDGEVRAAVEASLGRSIPTTEFMAFDDLEESVRHDVDDIRACGMLPEGSTVWGAVYDVDTGEVRVVVEPSVIGSLRA